MIDTEAIESALGRHERVGFQFSGGRDSVAALYVMRPYWERMTVYHMDTGDQFPETWEIVNRVAEDIQITVIRGDVRTYRETVGWPADVVPVDNTPFGRHVSGRELSVVSRYECCWQNLMRPMHERMMADGITLIVRGQRDGDYRQPFTRSGHTDGQIELLYPIESWTAADVDAYVAEHGLPNGPWYAEGASNAPTCMGCTAWLDDGRMPWLRKAHPEVFHAQRKQLRIINDEVRRQLAQAEPWEPEDGEK